MSHKSFSDIIDRSLERELIFSFGKRLSASRVVSNIMLKSPPHMNIVFSAISKLLKTWFNSLRSFSLLGFDIWRIIINQYYGVIVN